MGEVGNIAWNVRWKTGVLSDDIAAILPSTSLIIVCKGPFRSWTSMVLFQRYILLYATVFHKGKVRTVWAYYAENASWETVVLCDDIAVILPYRALYLQPNWKPSTLCSIYMSFMQLFQRYIIIEASVFEMGKVLTAWTYITENTRGKTVVL